MTWTPMSSPTRLAAAAPASVAAFTEATSPRTIAVTSPASTFCHPTNVTFAAFTIASVASTIPTNPRVSTRPRASPSSGFGGAGGFGRSAIFQSRGPLAPLHAASLAGAPSPRAARGFAERNANTLTAPAFRDSGSTFALRPAKSFALAAEAARARRDRSVIRFREKERPRRDSVPAAAP